MAYVYIETLIQRCATVPHIKQLQAHLLTTGNFQFCPLRSRLLDLCAVSPAGDLAFAILIFRHINEPATNDWNAIIRGVAAGPHPSRAVAWFRSMLRAASPRCRVDALTCSFTLKACARGLCSSTTAQLHAQTSRRGLIADALLCTTLLDAYCKTGDLCSAQNLFNEMPVRDIASWNALIAGLASGNRAYEALELYKRMGAEGLNPNEVTVLGALAACSHLGAFKEGEKIHGYIKDATGCMDQNVIVCNAIIDMYAKCGFVDKAYRVFDKMTCEKSLVTWNTMIMAFAMHGEAQRALEIFEQMRLSKVNPDSVSYLAALCACNHAGLVEYGVAMFKNMSSNGVEPNMKHYGSVVDLLGRAGRLKEANEIISSMPMVPDVVLWQSLLGASQIYKNVEMAETASRKLAEMGSNSCGDFVLLSNVYAAHERWNDVRRVRDAMKKRDVKKVPGFSYIEAEGLIHKFYNGDKSHEKWREIYQKLDEIRFKIMESGYVAATGFVLHDIGEEEKENALCFHSEKLALAFGLINTEEGTRIQVIKNLRICGDCHAVFKHVSKIYNREIIVRDRVRFHRFKEGSCSCRDYW